MNSKIDYLYNEKEQDLIKFIIPQYFFVTSSSNIKILNYKINCSRKSLIGAKAIAHLPFMIRLPLFSIITFRFERCILTSNMRSNIWEMNQKVTLIQLYLQAHSSIIGTS